MLISLPALPDPKLSANRYKKMVWREAASREKRQRETWLKLLREAFPEVNQFQESVDIVITVKGPKVLKADPWTHLSHRALKSLLDCLTEKQPDRYDKNGRLYSKNYGIGLLKDDSYKHIKSITVKAEQAEEEETVLEVE